MAKLRTMVLGIITALILVACQGPAQDLSPTGTETIDDVVVVRDVQYREGRIVGPRYEWSIDVPAEWVGEFYTESNGSTVVFFLGEEGDGAQLFRIEALSLDQYWAQNGSYPTQFVNLANEYNTYFTYYAPIDAFYSGLDDEVYDAILAQVPDVLATFSVEPVVGMLTAFDANLDIVQQ
ncbi:MAG: hypothetical protein AAFV98_13270 [Chloroflexota bacterium]